MKKFFMMAVMAVVALTASAQKGEFHITPHITGGYAYMSDAESAGEMGNLDLSSNFLGGVGVDLEYMLSNSFGLSVGADYNYVRSTTEKDGEGGKIYSYYSFLNVPVLAQYHFGEGFALKAGIQPMFLLEAKGHYEDGSDSFSESVKDEFKSAAFAIPVGISYTFATPVTVDLRYNIPVSKMNDFDGKDVRLHGITVSVGYRF